MDLKLDLNVLKRQYSLPLLSLSLSKLEEEEKRKKIANDWALNTASVCVCSVVQLCPIFCNPVDCSPPVSSVPETFQAIYFSQQNSVRWMSSFSLFLRIRRPVQKVTLPMVTEWLRSQAGIKAQVCWTAKLELSHLLNSPGSRQSLLSLTFSRLDRWALVGFLW